MSATILFGLVYWVSERMVHILTILFLKFFDIADRSMIDYVIASGEYIVFMVAL